MEREIKESCNRHYDCNVAELEYTNDDLPVPINFHCHDDCCEDCFGY